MPAAPAPRAGLDRRAASQQNCAPAPQAPRNFSVAGVSRPHHIVRTGRLTRRSDTLPAVDEVSFEAQPGEVLGFLGPNGAGKTTTMRMIAGFIAPTEGRASICGHDIEREPLAAKRALGYLPEGAPSYGEMSVKAFLEF